MVKQVRNKKMKICLILKLMMMFLLAHTRLS